MRPEVRQLDEAVPHEERCGEVQRLGDLVGRVGVLVEGELEAEDLGNRVAAGLVLEANVNGHLLALALVVCCGGTRAGLGRPGGEREKVDEEMPVLDDVVREGVEEDVERAGRIEVKVACTHLPSQPSLTEPRRTPLCATDR